MPMRQVSLPSIEVASCAAMLAIALCGCKTGELENRLDDMERRASAGDVSFRSGNYAAADSTFSGLAAEQTVSSPLYRLDCVPCLILSGKKDEAHREMLELRTEFEELYDPESEQKAQSKWHGEVNKVFKGSPHEMGTFYALLSLSYAERGEYEDAWRCVQNGLLHDADAENDKYRSDDALLLYLGSVFADKIGEVDSAAQCRRRLKETLAARKVDAADVGKFPKSAYAALLDENAPKPNAFVVFWTGTPPQYGRSGKYGEIRTTLKGVESAADFMTVSVDGSQEMIAPQKLGDINFQATTRGGREMDNILASKADFKQDMKNFQEVSFGISGLFFTAALATFDTSKEMLIVSGSLAAAGVAFLVVDGVFYCFYDKTDPRADIRAWKTLPGQLNVMPLFLPKGKHNLTARGYVGGDALSRCEFSIEIQDDTRMSVFHVTNMSDATLTKAEQLCNKTADAGNSSAPKDVVSDYPEIGSDWDTSVWYAVCGTDPSAGRFKLKDSSMPFPLWKALIRHKYLKHWSAAAAIAGTCPVRPDIVLSHTGSYWMLNKLSDGTTMFDTRVAIAVRGAGNCTPNGEFQSGPVKFFYAWSRQATQKTAINTFTKDEKESGVNAALDNLFRVREFREALSVGRLSSPISIVGETDPLPPVDSSTAATDVWPVVDEKSDGISPGCWVAHCTIKSRSVVAGQTVEAEETVKDTWKLEADGKFERIQSFSVANMTKHFSGKWTAQGLKLTVEAMEVGGEGDPVAVVYNLIPRADGSFEMRFDDLRDYEREVESSGGNPKVSARYESNGTLATRIEMPVPDQESVIVHFEQGPSVFCREPAEHGE